MTLIFQDNVKISTDKWKMMIITQHIVLIFLKKKLSSIERKSTTSTNKKQCDLSKSIRNRISQEHKQPERPGKLTNSILHCDSVIGNHLLHNQKCASHYKDNQFFILSKTQSDFHLSVLESIFITLLKPNLCRQKEFVYKHKLLA